MYYSDLCDINNKNFKLNDNCGNTLYCRSCRLNKGVKGKDLCDSCAKPKGLEKYSLSISEINNIKKTPENKYEMVMMFGRLSNINNDFCNQCNKSKQNEFRSGNTTAPL